MLRDFWIGRANELAGGVTQGSLELNGWRFWEGGDTFWYCQQESGQIHSSGYLHYAVLGAAKNVWGQALLDLLSVGRS